MQKSLASVLGLVLFIPACSSVFVDDDAERDRESAGESALERAAERHPGGVYQRWQARLSADGTMPDNALPRAKAQRDAMLAACGPAITGSQVQWTWLGPGNVGGRIRAVVLHPTNPLRIWCSSAGGGVWRTDDGGASWQPLNNVLGMLGSGCLVLDPTDANHLYLGTGEGFFETVEGSSNTAVLRGAGIWQSFDAGQTWAQIASTATPDFYFINRLAFSAADPHIMLAATGSGIWRSTDAGVTWSQRTTARTLDVDFHPTDGSQAVAGRDDGFALWSGDGGLSWNPAINPTLSTRIEVAYSRSNPTIVYCCANDVNDTLRVWRSGNGGHNYALQSATGIGTLGLYLSCLWVDPTNSNNIVFGGQTLYRSTDGGVTRTAFSGAHPDFHVAVEAPGFNGVINRRLYVGCDGGVFTRADWQTGSWTELNNQLGVTQFYGAAMSSTGVLLGGAQDNGTNRYTGGTETWNVNVIGGDGGHCAADPTDANYFYGESQYLGIARSSNAGLNWSDIRGATTGDPGFNFIPYFQLDPNNSNRMLACGRALWRTNNVKTGLPPTWTQIKPPRSCTFLGSGDPPPSHYLGNPPCNHSASAVALGNSDVIWVGHNDGEVYRTSNGTAAVPTWTQVDTNGTGLPDRWVSSIVIDPSNQQHVLVSLMGYEPDN
ncbi:MAG TPA: hypothetical protein VK348_08920, partial [Planctomycetota bacterium]|nr:hypothetical protein [Planctomycetota bacterium]